MRNKYPGICYRCKLWVPKGAGHFERWNGSWRIIHAECVIEQRIEKAKTTRKAEQLNRRKDNR